MSYKICLHGWGSECAAGVVPDNVAQYIKDKCYDDPDIYKEMLSGDEVPEEFKIAEDESMYYEADSFYYVYGPYDGCAVTVLDEFDNEVAEIDGSELDVETKYVSASKADGKPYFVWESVEKGWWKVEINTDEPFDKSKLKFIATKLSYDNDDNGIAHIIAVKYEDDKHHVEVDSTEGKSYELNFYKDDEKESD